MQICEIIAELEKLAPIEYAETYDNVGLLVGGADCECRGVLLALDLTLAVIEEAEKSNCNLIITHHPIFFKGLKQLDYSVYEGRLVRALVQKNLHFYAMHTNWDQVSRGVNYGIAKRLSLTNLEFMLKGGAEYGHGIWGILSEPMGIKDFLLKIKNTFACRVVRHSALVHSLVRRVGVCGGAGSFLIEQAYKQKLDILVTADLKYHDFFLAKANLIVCDIGHYESEQFAMCGVYEYLQGIFPNFALIKSKANTNPVQYLT